METRIIGNTKIVQREPNVYVISMKNYWLWLISFDIGRQFMKALSVLSKEHRVITVTRINDIYNSWVVLVEG
jgi:hypothetical protein